MQIKMCVINVNFFLLKFNILSRDYVIKRNVLWYKEIVKENMRMNQDQQFEGHRFIESVVYCIVNK